MKKSLIFLLMFVFVPLNKLEAERSPVETLAENFAQKIETYFPQPAAQLIYIDRQKVYINKGYRAMIKNGMKFQIARRGGPIFDPVTNEKIGEEWASVGDAQVIHVEQKYSVAVMTRTDTFPHVLDDAEFDMLRPRLLISVKDSKSKHPLMKTLVSLLRWKLSLRGFDVSEVGTHTDIHDRLFFRKIRRFEGPAFVLFMDYIKYNLQYRVITRIISLNPEGASLGILSEKTSLSDTYINEVLYEAPVRIKPPRNIRGGGLFVIRLKSKPGLDPSRIRTEEDIQLAKMLYKTIVSRDEAGNIIPALASDWRASADSTLWSFVIPPVKLSDGSSLKKSDIVAAWDRLSDTLAGSLWTDILGNIESYPDTGLMVQTDSSLVILNIKLKTPDQKFPLKLTLYPTSVYSLDTDSIPRGSGFFVLEKVSGNKLVLRKNSSSRSTYPEKLVVLFRDNTELIAAADDLVFSDTTEDKIDAPYLLWNGFILNISKKPLDHILIRRAIASAINREDFFSVGGNSIRPAYTLFPEYLYPPNTAVHPIKYDISAARKLMEITRKDVLFARPLKLYYLKDGSYRRNIMQIIQTQFHRIGIRVILMEAGSSELDNAVSNNEADIVYIDFAHTHNSDYLFMNNLLRAGSSLHFAGWTGDIPARLLNPDDIKSTESTLIEQSIVIPLFRGTPGVKVSGGVSFTRDYRLYPLGAWQKLWRER